MKLAHQRQYLKIWQERLRLQEWNVTIRWMTKAERTSPEYQAVNGYVTWNEQHKLAEIVINRDCEHIPSTVVHELLHLRIEAHGPCTGATDIPLEVAINSMTEAFIKLEGLHVR